MPKKLTYKPTFEALKGKQRAIETARKLKNALNKYFAGIVTSAPDEVSGETNYKLDEYPTVTNICLFLKISKRTWKRWKTYKGEEEEKKAIIEVILIAEMFCESVREAELLDGENFQGNKFFLEAQHDWNKNEVTDVETDEDEVTITIGSQTIRFT